MSSSFNRIEISPEIFIKIQTDDISTFYKFEENVGEGAYGSVYRAVSLRDKEIRAIKVIRKEVMKSSSKGLLLAELELLRKMDHPNIIKLFEIFESERAYYVVTEFCEGGSIIDLIRQRRCVKEEYIRIIILQLLSCLNYMHKLKIVHRDIKLENVVLLKSIREYSKPEDIEIRLLDFGTAFKMHNFV